MGNESENKDIDGPIQLASKLRGQLPSGVEVRLFDHIERKSYLLLEIYNGSITNSVTIMITP